MSTVRGYHPLKFEWDIMIHVGGYHEYHGGCSVPWGTQITKDLFIANLCLRLIPEHYKATTTCTSKRTF